jgi:ubiquinone/menaquinone biosynthesis C-methylase UbiE/uncharacterized protein YbaR (Trm112 family)
MRYDLLRKLICPSCLKDDLHLKDLGGVALVGEDVETGVLLCKACHAWYPVIYGVPLLLAEVDLYQDVRTLYHEKYSSMLGLSLDSGGILASSTDKKQVTHYSEDSAVYDDLVSGSTFWQASDWNTLYRWLEDIDESGTILDIGCGTGRCTIPLINMRRKVISFDISLSMVLAAKKKAASLDVPFQPDFIVANACNIPLKSGQFSSAISFGVLHHVHEPLKALQEGARVLHHDGVLYCLENNASFFRPVFDFVMSVYTLWNEEAGSHPCLHRSEVQKWANSLDMSLSIHTSTFILPHVFNFLPLSFAKWLLAATDRLFSSVPFLKDQGGQLVIVMKKNRS